MRIDTLNDDFTNDLESFVKNPFQLEPVDQWDPTQPGAPERHLAFGKEASLTREKILYALQTSSWAEMIESMVRVYITSNLLDSLEEIDPVKEQVWMMGHKWISRYCELLTEPGVMKSEFFRQHNDRFLILLKSMVAVHPGNRITFVHALRTWCPKSDVLRTEEPILLPSPMKGVESSPPTPVEPVASSGPVGPETVASSAPSSKPRLALIRPAGSEERNKTRRNRHN
jgi:hypothetical protein